MIPVFDATLAHDADLQRAAVLHNGPGALVLAKCFDQETMVRLRDVLLAEMEADEAEHPNTTHPLQSGKRVLPAALEHIASKDPVLAARLVSNPWLTTVLDNLLGFAVLGSMTGHTIRAGGAGQEPHTDYPGHVRSGYFWERDAAKFKRYVNEHCRAQVLPFTSVQVLIAPVPIGVHNGGTHIYLGTHRERDIDVLSATLPTDARVQCPALSPGDVLVFNRGVAHRGGANRSAAPRPALICQWTTMFTTPQHRFHMAGISNAVAPHLSAEETDAVLERVERVYPVDNRLCN